MSASTHVSARLLTALAFVVTVAAIVVPTSIASVSNGKYGPLDGWAYAAIHYATPSAPQEILRDSGDANLARSVRIHRATLSASQEIVRDSGDASLARSVRAQAARGQTRQESGGFDWGTTGMSAAGAFGLIVLAGGTTLAFRRRSQLRHVQS